MTSEGDIHMSRDHMDTLDILAGVIIVLGLPFAMALDLFDNLTGWMRK